MEGERGGSTVCVTGASGFIGSWLVMRLLERGYYVKATARDPANIRKVRHLLELPNASTHLSLWKADLIEEGSFDDAINGCVGVFHVATPMGLTSLKDPESEMIKPTVDGVLNVMRSCSKAKTVKRIIYTSTIGAIFIQQNPPSEYDESFWTDVEFCKSQKMFLWDYYVAKTMAEKVAWEFAKENGLDLVAINPSRVLGPFISSSMHICIEMSLALITRNEVVYPWLVAITQDAHMDDVCNAHIYLYEHPEARGRYICSSHCSSIFDISKGLCQKYPDCNIPTEFEGIDESLKPIPCSSKKLVDLGFKFKYSSEECHVGDLFYETIESSREKGLIPLQSAGSG